MLWCRNYSVGVVDTGICNEGFGVSLASADLDGLTEESLICTGQAV